MARVLLVNDSAAFLHRLEKQLRPLLPSRDGRAADARLPRMLASFCSRCWSSVSWRQGTPRSSATCVTTVSLRDLGLEDLVGCSEPVGRNDARVREIEAADGSDGVPFGQQCVAVLGSPAQDDNECGPDAPGVKR